ncbi:MAG: hypothetical protein AMS27_09300 [Bacteroides sp. SM23_62_1]|nr:MAG: hypothetical protein AMS27_09300 [Bacteroides sp. SM23_62_1]
MSVILIILFYILFPVLVLYLSNKYPIVKKIGPVIICYSTGLILGNVGIMPDNATKYQDVLNNIVIVFAIPLLLFSLDVKSWLRMAGKTFLSLILGLVSVLVMVVLSFFLFREKLPELWKVGGMLIGLYSGGTPNLAAIKIALNVDPETYILTHTSDLVIGTFVLLFLITIAQKTFLLFMRPFKTSDLDLMENSADVYKGEFESYDSIFTPKIFFPLLKALGLVAIIFGVSFLLSKISLHYGLVKNASTMEMTIIILGITTFGIIASLSPDINKIEKTFQLGMYFILVFCVVVSSMADIRSFSFSSWPIFVCILLAVVGALILHGILSWIFDIDVDNFLIISTALCMSPAFVPVVAGALKNRFIIIPGLVIGIIGFAIGNYLGVLVALLLKQMTL